MLWVGFLCVVSVTLASKENDSGIIVEIRNGKIRGKTITSIKNKTNYMFLEIPYAQPPIGNLRFKDPLPVNNWTGVLNTTKNTKICWEKRLNVRKEDPRQNEDCLYQNVFSPVPPGPRKVLLPVFVYVYGGQHMAGDGTYGKIDFQNFVDSGIIVVTMNYRSGALGYLATEDGVISGNRGLKDQHLSLQWVQDNIHFFGGDSSKVTLAGHSSGAMCVSFHLISPIATGLFRAAITQSGSVISPLAYTQRARMLAFEMGKKLSPNFSYKNSSEDLLKLLMESPARKITMMNFPHLLLGNNTLEKTYESMLWKPIIERPDIRNAYVTRLPHDSLLKGQYHKVPLLIGITSEEYINQRSHSLVAGLNRGRLLLENENIKLGFRNLLEERIRSLYVKNTFDDVAEIKYVSDYIFSIGPIRYAELHARYAPTFFYKFSYYGKINDLAHKQYINIKGVENVGHCDELPYLIYYRGNASEFYKFPESDLLIQKKMVKLWTNFVKYMNPTPEQDQLTEYIKWPKVSKDIFTYLDINSNLTIVHDFPRTLYREWVKFIDDYYRHPLGSL